jgi:hypothetical protein
LGIYRCGGLIVLRKKKQKDLKYDKIHKHDYNKYKAFPFKKASDRPTMPVWLQADPVIKKRLELIRKEHEKSRDLIEKKKKKK